MALEKTPNNIIKPLVFDSDSAHSFPMLLKQITQYVHETSSIDNTIKLTTLAHYFNTYLNHLADLCEQKDIWEHKNAHSSENMFTPFYKEAKEIEHGHAFIAQYKESTILRRLFSIDTKTLHQLRFAPYEQPCNDYSIANKNSAWFKIQDLLVTGQEIINTIGMIKKAQMFHIDDIIEANIERLKIGLLAFPQKESIVLSLFDTQPPSTLISNKESSFFYPINPEILNKLNGHQLATLCLEELNNRTPSVLIKRVLKNKILWQRMEQALASGVFDGRLDEPQMKIKTLHQWHELVQNTNEQFFSNVKKMGEIIISLRQQLTDKKDIEFKLKNQIQKTLNLEQQLKTMNQNTLQQQVDALQEEVKQHANRKKELKEQLQENRAIQKEYEQNKNTQLFRMERIAPVLFQVQNIERKAVALKNRNELQAFNTANHLAQSIRMEIRNYAANEEQDEQVALELLQKNAKEHIKKSKVILCEHRQEWKYLLGNLSLGVLTAGIGYAAAAMINKYTTGNYTFFSKTDSEKHLDELEKALTFSQTHPTTT